MEKKEINAYMKKIRTESIEKAKKLEEITNEVAKEVRTEVTPIGSLNIIQYETLVAGVLPRPQKIFINDSRYYSLAQRLVEGYKKHFPEEWEITDEDPWPHKSK
jgi:hypothetical protein